MRSDVEILIVGAGPVGLLLARLLRARGRDCLVIEKRPAAPAYSMAIGITPPSLEILEGLGLAEEFVSRGVKITDAHIHENGRYLGRVSFEKIPAAHRFILSLPQGETVEILARGLPVWRGVELTGLQPDANGVTAQVGERTIRYRYLIGCDGARSTVRSLAGIPVRTKTYRPRFVMGDFPDDTGWGAEAHLFFSARGAVESFPLPGGKRRWIAQTAAPRPSFGHPLPALRGEGWGEGMSDFQPEWQLAERFHVGRVILCGDAAHVMSPIGGQGMNVGFGDAVMLANELAGEKSFGRYEQARRRVFREAAARAARGMWLGTRRGPVWSALRRVFIRDVLLRPGMSERVAARFAMLSLVDLSRRQMLPELMDAADADPVKLSRTYRQFRLINRVVSRYRTILRRYVLDDMAREPNRVYRLVDIGAGGCEIAVWLLREARRRGLRLTVTAIDVDPRAVTFSQSRYGAVPGLEIREMDAFQIEQLGPVDYVFSNHVLHHLPDAQIVALLRVLQRNVRRRIVCSDLERNQFSYTVFSLLTRPLLRRSFARVDGLLSIRKGFVGHELAELATKAEIKAEVQRMCPGRVVLVCEGNLKVVRPLGLEPRTR